jgi:hypothetical protein
MAIPNKRTSADFTFKHSGQVDEYGASIGDATVIQANFDQRAIDNMTAINNLIDSLIDTTEGETGADGISSTPLATGVSSNIQANLEFLQQAINDVVLGQIPDGSLTYEKLSPSLVENLATVENLKTLTKNGIITDELNEMAISANNPNDRSINIDTGKLLLDGSIYTYDTLMNVSIGDPEVANVPSEPHTLDASGNLTLDHVPIGKSDASALAEVGDIVVTDVGTGNPINVTSIDPSTGEVVTEGTDGTTVSVSYYPFTKRIDVVYADINDGTINVEKGTGEISGTEPTKPSPTNALELCEILLDFNYDVISDNDITPSLLYGGFRGLGQIPLDAWLYVNFKYELTESEITDIEANSSLMDIINNYSGGGAVGQVSMFAMVTPPTHWLECNGATISREVYSDLFDKIGTTFGSGDGSTTFNIPDLRGEFIRGLDNGRGVDTGRTLGSLQSGSKEGYSENLQVGYNNNLMSVSPNDSDGSIRPRNVALMFCIKYK